MDIKKTIEDIVEKIKGDEVLQKQFLSDPAGALEKLTGIDLPTGQLDAVMRLWRAARRSSPPTTSAMR